VDLNVKDPNLNHWSCIILVDKNKTSSLVINVYLPIILWYKISLYSELSK